ncbi:MAG: hypothetical protein ABIO65_06005, partial [Nitrospiria bacterium]
MVFRRRCFLRSPRLLPLGLALIIWGLAVQASAQTASQPTIVPPLSPNLVTYGLTTSRPITIYGSGFVAGATITVGNLSGATVAGDVADEVTRYVF